MLFTSEQPALEILKFPTAFTHKMTFWSANYSPYVVYNKTIIRLSVGETAGYSRFVKGCPTAYKRTRQCRKVLSDGT